MFSFGCKKKRWVYEPLLYRIKGRWQPPRGWQSSLEDEAPIDPPFFILYVYVMKLFFSHRYINRGGSMGYYLIRVKGKWTIDPPFNLTNIWWWMYFRADIYKKIFLTIEVFEIKRHVKKIPQNFRWINLCGREFWCIFYKYYIRTKILVFLSFLRFPL